MRRPMLRVSNSSTSGSRPRNAATSTMCSAIELLQPSAGRLVQRVADVQQRRAQAPRTPRAARRPARWRPAPASPRRRAARRRTPSGPGRRSAPASRTARSGRRGPRAPRPAGVARRGANRRAPRQRRASTSPAVAGHVRASSMPVAARWSSLGGLAHLDGVAHRVVERDAALPQRVPDRLGDLLHALLARWPGHAAGRRRGRWPATARLGRSHRRRRARAPATHAVVDPSRSSP